MVPSQCAFCNASLRPEAQHCPACGEPHLLQGKYIITRHLGTGGFGEVYEATGVRLKRRYAIKMITSPSAEGQQYVEAEADLLAQYARKFDFMPEIYDIWSDRPRSTVLAMEYIEGRSLKEILEQNGPWLATEVERFLVIVLGHLSRLHAEGVVHRDIKPANIHRTPDDRYVLLDFGIAKRQGVTIAKAASLDYAPPEQLRSMSTDERSDLFALGATAYHLLCGHPPINSLIRFSTNQPVQWPIHIINSTTLTLRTAIEALLEVEPTNRPATAQQALELLIKNLPQYTPPVAINARSVSPPLPITSPPLAAAQPTSFASSYFIMKLSLTWTLITAISGMLGIFLGAFVASNLYRLIGRSFVPLTYWWERNLPYFIADTVFSMISFGIVGLSQWFFIKRYISNTPRVWMFFGAISGIISGITVSALSITTIISRNEQTVVLLFVISSFLFIGAYWLIFRHAIIRKIFWFFTNIFGLVLFVGGLFFASSQSEGWFALLGVIVAWILFSICTGISLRWTHLKTNH